MPSTAAITKVEATRALGAIVRAEWDIVDEAIAAAVEHASTTGRPLVHPFDDLDVIAGQATLGQEIVEDVPDVAALIVPLGGGGLLAGIGVALERAGCRARLIGVRSEDAPPRAPGTTMVPSRASVADGIAVRTKGRFTVPLVEELADDVVRVDDDDTAEAIVHLFERAKLVVEGAGAVGVAALLRGLFDPAITAGPDGTIVVVLSGGNIDPGLFGDAIRRHEIKVGRRLAIVTRLDDRPGALVRLLTGIADLGANVLDIDHQRDGIDLPFGTTAVQLVVQTRDRAHGEAVLAWARDAGFDIARVFGG